MQTIINKDAQSVTESFNTVITQLSSIADDIKQSCADAIMVDDYDKVDRSKASAMALKSFIQEVSDLSNRWNKGMSSQSKPMQKVVTSNLNHSHTRASQKKLLVTFLDNGKQIFRTSAANTFVEALRLFNLDYVARLEKIANKHLLVSKTKYREDNIHQCGNWYIDTLSNTIQKKNFLEEISKELKIPIRVEIV
jgi:hypothetical protein